MWGIFLHQPTLLTSDTPFFQAYQALLDERMSRSSVLHLLLDHIGQIRMTHHDCRVSEVYQHYIPWVNR